MPEDPPGDRPRARRRDDEDDDRPRRRRDEDDDDYDDRPRRRRRRRDEDDDGTGGLIPYKNPKALIAYYCGVFGLASCIVGGVGGIFGVVPIILGLQGLKYAKEHPASRGQAHAIVGIVLGSLEVLTALVATVFIIVAILKK